MQKSPGKDVEMWPGECKPEVWLGEKEIPVTCLQNQRDRALKMLQNCTKGCTREREEGKEPQGKRVSKGTLASVASQQAHPS